MKKYITLVLMMMFFGTLNAHPLGIFSVNRYTRIELAGAKLRLVYVTDIAEISTIQEFARIDINHDGNADDQERRLYAESKMQEIMSGFVLTIDGKEIPVRATGYDISFPEGQGGLRTIRFSPTFEGSLPSGQASHTLNFVDHNAEERMGWKEIVLHPMNGEKVERSSVSQTDVANELRNYPADRLTNPLQQLEATIQFTPGNTTGVSSVSSFTQSIIEKTKDGFAELISAKDLSVPVMMVSLLIAMMLGAGHALTPGHGKTIVAAYLVGQRGTAKHAAFLGLTVTATHTIGVFAMGLIALDRKSVV